MKFSNLSKCVIRAASFALLTFAISGCGGGGGTDEISGDSTSGTGLFPNSPTSFKMRETIDRASTDQVWCLGQPVATQLTGVSVMPLVMKSDTVYFQYVGSSVKMWNGTEMVTFLPSSIKVGDTWSFTTQGSVTNVLVLPKQTITVPEGTHADCWGIRMTSVRSASETWTTTLWFAVNVGLIKQTEAMNGTAQSNMELVTRNLPSTQAAGSSLLPLKSKTMVMGASLGGQPIADVMIMLSRQNAGLTSLTTPGGTVRLFTSGDAVMMHYTEIGEDWTLIPATVQVGSTWLPQGTATSFNGTVLRTETVTVPAGTFNCFVVQFRGIMSNTTWWCAPGVGVVKYEAPMEMFNQTGILKYMDMRTLID